MKKLGIVLEGGGVKGAYQCGALEALCELGMSVDGIVGTSIGAVNGALFLQGGISLLSKVWDKIDTNTIFELDEIVIEKLKTDGLDLQTMLFMTKNVKSIFQMLQDSEKKSKAFFSSLVDEKAIRESALDFGAVAFNISDMKPAELMKEAIPQGQLVNFVIASAAFPIFPSIEIDGKKYIDGGVWDNMPINLIARNGYEKLLVIRTNPASKEPKRKQERDDLAVFTILPDEDLGHALAFADTKIARLREKGRRDAILAWEYGLKDFLQI